MGTNRVFCPKCREQEEVHHSRFRVWDLPFLFIAMRAYRCMMCNRRFYSWKRGSGRIHGRKAAEKSA
jgi:hypothetical protein